jgi:hypothetical protein
VHCRLLSVLWDWRNHYDYHKHVLMQTNSRRPHHITRSRTDFQNSVLFVVVRNVCTMVTILLGLCLPASEKLSQPSTVISYIEFRKRWRDQLHLEDQGTGNTPKPSWTWWWWWIHVLFMCGLAWFDTQSIIICICQMDYIHEQVLLPTNCASSHMHETTTICFSYLF